MRILVVQETDWIQRNPILHHRLLEALAADGDEIVVFDHEIHWRRGGLMPLWRGRSSRDVPSRFGLGSSIRLVRPGMVRISGIARPTWLITTLIELHRHFRTGRPDVVIAYGISNSLLAWVFARLHGVPFVFHLFDSLHALAEPSYLAPVARIVEMAGLRVADQVIIGHRALESYVRRMGVPQRRITFIPNGIDVLPTDAARRAATRARLGISDEQVVMLFMGWLYDFSGIDQIAAQLLADRERYAHFTLLVVGDGDLEPAIRRMRQLLPERILMMGRRPREEMPDYLAAADVCLLPARPTKAMLYIVPTKVDEYMEAGKPVAATRLPGMVSEFGSMPGIIWVDDAADVLPRLTSLLDRALDWRRRLVELGDASRTYASRRDDWNTVIRRFRETIASVQRRA